jgi:starch synthase
VKKALLEECGIDLAHVDPVPLVAMITRLVDQKGLDLLERGFDAVMALGVDIVILGTGLPKYHDLLAEAARRYAGRMGLFLKFDNGLAHRIEGGADLFLMPSLYEPCGLNQMYSLRYGTVPVVRATGGLADTVRDDDANPGNGVGFVFHEYTDEAMVDALARAVAAYREPKRWQGIVERAMAEDHSWQASARAYIDLYESALERRRATEGVGAR